MASYLEHSHVQAFQPRMNHAVGLIRLGGKWPVGLTLVPWCTDKRLTWDVTAVSTLVDSYVDSADREAGVPAERAQQ